MYKNGIFVFHESKVRCVYMHTKLLVLFDFNLATLRILENYARSHMSPCWSRRNPSWKRLLGTILP